MEKSYSSLTVLFEPPFWVGIFELTYNGCYRACKVTFGAEPTDPQIYEFILRNFTSLEFSPSIKAGEHCEKRINPKRLRREINRQQQSFHKSTKSQQALSLLHSEKKQQAKARSKQLRNEEKERIYELKKQKRKAKHRGYAK